MGDEQIDKIRKQYNWYCPYQSVVRRGNYAVLNHFDGHNWIQFTKDIDNFNQLNED